MMRREYHFTNFYVILQDGIDLDWEYPEADDRSGRPEDFANFPKFMKNLKAALKKYEVSITLPASYCE